MVPRPAYLSLQLQPDVDVHQHRTRGAEKHHAVLGPVNHHLRRRAFSLATSPVTPTIPDDVIPAAVLHAHDLIALLHQHFPRDDEGPVVRDRVLLWPLALRRRRGCDVPRRIVLDAQPLDHGILLTRGMSYRSRY